jgi:hypothetical protein
MSENALPLLSFGPGSLPPIRERNDDYDSDDERPGHPRRWYHYVPLCSECTLVSHQKKIALLNSKLLLSVASRGSTSLGTTPVNLARPPQLSLPNPPRAILLCLSPPRHLHALLPRI